MVKVIVRQQNRVESWEFIDAPELAENAKLLLDIYEGNVDTIAFVAIPVAIE